MAAPPVKRCKGVMLSDFALASRLDTTIICMMSPVGLATMHSQRNAGALLNQAEGVSSLMPKARRLLELRRILLRALPPNLAKSCSIANATQEKIVLFAENSAIAAKLKLLAPSLRDQFLKAGVEATSLVIHVQPHKFTPTAFRKEAVLTEEAVRALRQLMRQLPDSDLKRTLASLAGRAQDKAGKP